MIVYFSIGIDCEGGGLAGAATFQIKRAVLAHLNVPEPPMGLLPLRVGAWHMPTKNYAHPQRQLKASQLFF